MNFSKKSQSLLSISGEHHKNKNSFVSENLKNKLRFALAIMVTILFISCSVEDGAMGPAGANGKDGANGQNGKDGNVNVTAVLVENVEIKRNELKTFTVNAITEDILRHGAVLAYIQNSSSSVWFPLPFIQGDLSRTLFDMKLINLEKSTL